MALRIACIVRFIKNQTIQIRCPTLPADSPLPPNSRNAAADAASGALRAGDRIISARKLAEREQVSLPTALEALRCLEAEGLIIARPRSGYFVRQITPAGEAKRASLPGPCR
jgi:DNA-binding transcriptional MocR family regulator